MSERPNIEALVAQHAKATEGEWSADGLRDNRIIWSSPENRVCFMAIYPKAHADSLSIAALHNAFPALIAYIAHLEARDKVQRDALEDAASRFIGYAEMHALKLMDGSITAAERMAIRGKVDRNFTYAYEVRAALAGGAA